MEKILKSSGTGIGNIYEGIRKSTHGGISRSWKVTLLSFILPVIIMVAVYIFVGIYPFGEKSILSNDLSAQYIELMQYFRKVLQGEKSFIYSFNIGMGKSMLGSIAYVLASPLNILLIFFPENSMPTVVLVIILIKYGLAGMTFNFYIRGKYGSQDYVGVFFSICYALMAYNICYTLNLMWLDGILLFPLILYYTDRLAIEGRKRGLVLYLGLSIITNFYIGYIIILLTVIYYWYQLLSGEYGLTVREGLRKFPQFIGAIIISGMLSAFLTLPTYLSIVRENTLPSLLNLNINYKTGDLFSKLFIGSFDTLKTHGLPNLYCGIGVLVLVVAYFINYRKDRRRRAADIILLLIMYASIKIEILYITWHAFDKPNWFPARFSFGICFFLICIAYRSYRELEEGKGIMPICWSVAGLGIGLLFLGNEYMTRQDILINIFIMCSYLIVFTMKPGEKSRNMLIYGIIVAEIFMAVLLIQDEMEKESPYVPRNEYVTERSALKSTLKQIKDKDRGVYRIEKTFARRFNDGIGHDYMSVDMYHSIYNRNLNKFLRNMGLTFFDKYGSYNGNTPVTDALFGIKYIISDKEERIYPLLEKSGSYNIYRNNNAFSIGTVVSMDILDMTHYKEYKSPFILQEEIIRKISGTDERFFIKEDIRKESRVNLKVTEEGDNILKYEKVDNKKEAYIEYIIDKGNEGNLVYMNIGNPIKIGKKIKFTINGNDMGNVLKRGTEVIMLEKGEKIRIALVENTVEMNRDKVYKLERKRLEEALKGISMQHFTGKVKDGYVRMRIRNEGDGKILMTSIPYENGWTAQVNGKSRKISRILDTFIGVELDKGNNDVILSFEAPGLKAGIIITLAGIIILFLMRQKER